MSVSQCQPTVFLSHGAGPSFYMDATVEPKVKGLDKDSNAVKGLKSFVADHNIITPKALVVFSAHYDEDICSVTSSENYSLDYDYGDFQWPPETYEIRWPVVGAPDVAMRVKELLESKGISCNADSNRGLDHGVFVPLKLVFPEADIPVIEVSLLKSLDMAEHLKIGEALSDLSKENILVIGSGFASHAGMCQTDLPWAEPYRKWLHDLVSNPKYSAKERKDRFLAYSEEKSFSSAHKTIEHFLPIAMSCAASGYQPGTILHSEFVMGSLLYDHYKFQAK
ncbi:4,5-DOPA dioxygenase extradiol-like [Mizuhopecten yessoensis]|uniref:4,5-DOPA dioxygenase extradiol-like n=1 Tax=Mizuhopecten yessoensis TaxID=6573 RepID=UPI000B45D165|nr:4,5-DOPA dioxygenase extradiol-like [Mizuhopecten yessoensis]XP_021363374.1 4,5-DOPA dioxygenase extradiol-like [Mizuhopecten yessoensis]